MWSYRIVAPYQFEKTSIAEKTPDCLGDGQVLLRFLAAGVCGSDMPAFRGVRGKQQDFKKAFVTLADGHRIDVTSGL